MAGSGYCEFNPPPPSPFAACCHYIVCAAMLVLVREELMGGDLVTVELAGGLGGSSNERSLLPPCRSWRCS